jgi:hypothetical protein
MDAEQLYRKSELAMRGKREDGLGKSGLPIRIHNALCRHYGEQFDKETVQKLVESGEIWSYRDIGAKSVRVICEWLLSKSQ